MEKIKRYIVVEVREIIHATDDRDEAITVAENKRGRKYSFIDVYDLITRENIYEWSY